MLLKRIIFGSILLSSFLVLSACGKANVKMPVSGNNLPAIESILINEKGEEIGQVSLTEGEDGLSIHVQAEGLSPGLHGFHIHEKGECIPPTFDSSGGHFNPTNKEHGFDNPKGFHLGDLPNLKVGKDGTVNERITTQDVTLKKGVENSITDYGGTSIMIHEKKDDYKTDPAGEAGARVACAIIHQ